MAHELQVKGKKMAVKEAQDLPDNTCRMDITPQKHIVTRLPDTDNKILHEAETNTTPGLSKGLLACVFVGEGMGSLCILSFFL